jgi:hypothetical protein
MKEDKMEKKCKQCAMMIPNEAKICPHCRQRQGLSGLVKYGGGFLLVMFAIAFLGSLIPKSKPVATQPTAAAQPANQVAGKAPNASDDEVYNVVSACMHLQFDLTPGWVPSGTDKSAFCISNAVDKYGETRVTKWIVKWVKGLSMDHMTLLDQKEINAINMGRRNGSNLDKTVATMFIANSTIKVYEIQQRNK